MGFTGPRETCCKRAWARKNLDPLFLKVPTYLSPETPTGASQQPQQIQASQSTLEIPLYVDTYAKPGTYLSVCRAATSVSFPDLLLLVGGSRRSRMSRRVLTV